MDTLLKIFGEGKDLNTLNMCSRAFVIFLIALVLIRISGRRSFGVRTALDNIIVVLLGAILSRAVSGASPFVPTVAASLTLVFAHRLAAWSILRSDAVSGLVEGDKIMLFEGGKFIEDNLKKALVCKEDVMQGVRKSALTEDLEKVEKIYIERNGEITLVKKES
jgi:uncharacterized membrane protein YcaP (DUF421 family)